MAGLVFLLGVLAWGQSGPQPLPGKPVVLPTEFSADRFFVVPVAKDGTRLRLYTDSAGGLFLFDDVVKALHLSSASSPQPTPLPDFKPNAWIPSPSANPLLFVIKRRKDVDEMSEWLGMLGQQWFADRVWTWDYPRHTLALRAPGDLPRHKQEQEVPLWFQTSALGKRKASFARLQITVDGEPISFLFDTGALNVYSPEVLKMLKDSGPPVRAASFLAQSLYDKWHKKHPEWPAYEQVKTATGATLIQVPKVTVGGETVGPVWFTVQPDRAFHTYMAQWMDQPTEGALGGTLWKYFRVTVDYPHSLMVLERARR